MLITGLLLVIAIETLLLFHIHNVYYFCPKSIKSRLSGYARLKGNLLCKCGSDGERKEDPAEFEVLLGILKKIEMKNAGLSVFVIFALGFSLQAMSGANEPLISSESWSLSTRDLAAILASSLICPLLLSLNGLRQIDQLDFLADLKKIPKDQSEALKKALRKDMIKKERGFHFSWNVARVAVPLYAFTLVLLNSDLGVDLR